MHFFKMYTIERKKSLQIFFCSLLKMEKTMSRSIALLFQRKRKIHQVQISISFPLKISNCRGKLAGIKHNPLFMDSLVD